MKCYYHPEIEAVATCIVCGKAICQTCSVDVAGRITCQRCLSVGNVAYPQKIQIQPSKPINPLAIVSLVLGILGLCGGIPFAIAAWITGHMALKQLSENPSQEGLRLANAGKWLGVGITVLYSVILLLAIIFYGGAIIISLLQQQSY